MKFFNQFNKDRRSRVRLANYKANKLGLLLVYDSLQELFTVYKNPELLGVFTKREELYVERDINILLDKLRLTSEEFKSEGCRTSYRFLVINFNEKDCGTN